VAAGAAAIPAALPGDGRADAACVLFVHYGGAPFLGSSGSLPAADLGRRVGTGIVPGCNDVVGPGAPAPVPDTAVAVRRVTGVAPRLAVAMRLGGGPHALMVRDGAGCARIEVADRLACLRRATQRLLRGPSLVAPMSARAGATVRVGLRLPGRPARPPAGPVVLRRAGPSSGPLAGPLVRSGDAVVVPDVAPGEYRIVAIEGGRGLAARITIR
jgi:hypothetical protein